MTTLRRELQKEIRALTPGARGRRAFEMMLRRLTTLELIAATGIKPRIRVKAEKIAMGEK